MRHTIEVAVLHKLAVLGPERASIPNRLFHKKYVAPGNRGQLNVSPDSPDSHGFPRMTI